MDRKRKIIARYYIVRGNQALWNGDPAESGAQFRQVVITSDEWNSTRGIFQVYALAGVGKGIQNGKLAVSTDDPKVLFDQDFQGLEAASKKLTEIVEEAVAEGFKPVSLIDVLEFEAKRRGT